MSQIDSMITIYNIIDSLGLKYCERSGDCTNSQEDCHKNEFITGHYGVCAPEDCENDKCDQIGDTTQGLLSGVCRNGKCDYSSPLLMATNNQGQDHNGSGFVSSRFQSLLMMLIILIMIN